MNKADLEKIVAIAEEGSMARASQKLFITQPALSKALTKVEEELGETLFTRRPSGLELTYAGECFLRKAYQILKLYSDVDMEFCELNQMRKGILKVGSADRLGALVLPELLRKFHERYPNIRIEIVEQNSIKLEESLLMGALDLAILCLPLKNTNVKYQVFYEDPIYVAVPSWHPLNRESYAKEGEEMRYLPIGALQNQTFILTKPTKKTRMAADRILSNLNGHYQVGIESLNIETVISLVAGGLGISLVPNVFTKTYLTGDKVNYYQLEEQYAPRWQWAVIYNDSLSSLSRPSRELYHILCDEGCCFPDYI